MRQKKLTPDTDLSILPLVNASFQGGLFTTLFIFFKDETLKAILHGTALHVILFPLAALAEIITALVSGINLHSAANKNFGRVLTSIFDILKALAIPTAVFGSIFAAELFAVASPVIFTVVLSANVLKNVGLLIWNAYNMYETEDMELFQIYKAGIKAHFIDVVVGSVVTAAIVLLMLSPAGPAVTFGIAITAATTMGLATVYGIIQGVPFLRNGKDKCIHFLKGCFGLAIKEEPSIFETQQLEPLFGSLFADNEIENSQAKQVLLSSIESKIKILSKEIQEAELHQDELFSFIESSQKPKREAKINVLQTYRKMLIKDKKLEDLDAIFDDTNTSLSEKKRIKNSIFKENITCLAHQSFWKPQYHGGVEEISRNFENYLETYASR